MRSNPLCCECQALGITRLWTQRDHIVPLAEGGTDDPSNIQGLCDEHHDAKSKAEALRARGVVIDVPARVVRDAARLNAPGTRGEGKS